MLGHEAGELFLTGHGAVLANEPRQAFEVELVPRRREGDQIPGLFLLRVRKAVRETARCKYRLSGDCSSVAIANAEFELA